LGVVQNEPKRENSVVAFNGSPWEALRT